jgi:hypothetical protein
LQAFAIALEPRLLAAASTLRPYRIDNALSDRIVDVLFGTKPTEGPVLHNPSDIYVNGGALDVLLMFFRLDCGFSLTFHKAVDLLIRDGPLFEPVLLVLASGDRLGFCVSDLVHYIVAVHHSGFDCFAWRSALPIQVLELSKLHWNLSLQSSRPAERAAYEEWDRQQWAVATATIVAAVEIEVKKKTALEQAPPTALYRGSRAVQPLAILPTLSAAGKLFKLENGKVVKVGIWTVRPCSDLVS